MNAILPVKRSARAAVQLRAARPGDAPACGRIIYDAFDAIAERHAFKKDFPSVEAATRLAGMLLAQPGQFALVAERDGRVVGCNFLDERSPIAGVGPLAIAPAAQNSGIGRQLMEAVMQRAQARRFPGVRLVQAGYHARSLSLYTKFGYIVREPLANVQGGLNLRMPGCDVRPALALDEPACNALCHRVHGHDRAGELRDAVAQGTATVVVRAGRIAAYATIVGFFGHAVAETNDDLKALIGATPEFAGPGILVPTRNADLFRWCLEQGLRVNQTETLMAVGLYNEPQGAWLPSVMY